MLDLKRIKWTIVFLCTVFITGIGGYMLIESWPFIDALYMVVITLATVGYGETHNLSFEGRIFTILLIVVWAAIGVYAVGNIIQPIIEGGIRKALGRRKLEKEIKALKNHYIVCGFGRMGSYVTRELQDRGVPCVAIEKDEALLDKLEREAHLYICGDATEDEIILKAGVQQARGLIGLLSSDADNVYLILTARELNPNLFIIARSTGDASESRLQRAGANKVICPYQMGAIRMVQAILRPAVVDFMEIAIHGKSKELQLEELTVHHDSSLIGASLKEADVRKNWDVIIVAIKDASGRMVFKPSSETCITAGETLITLGETKDLMRFARVLHPSSH
ncbi:MAG: potassium channel protein [Deltaproteobacteria bacterium]|nr:potassium channel protein [Deltaproteobacteria bacterium]